jgi:hypothetical protein
MGKLYEIIVKEDGTWLYLNGPTKKAVFCLENMVYGPISKAAVAEIREALGG